MKTAVAVTALLTLTLSLPAAAENGVTDNSIVLGQSAALSGPAASLGTEMRDGANVYFRHINSQGGVHGRQIRLISLDDGYEPARTVPNTQLLLNEHKVFALFGYVGTPTSYAVLPLVNDARVPFFAPFTGAEGLRSPSNRYVFNIRASYLDETERQVAWLMSQGKRQIAVFYQNDAYGKAGLTGVEQAMARRNLTIAATGTVERNTVKVADAVATINRARPDAVIMVSAYKSCAEFIRQTRQTGRDPLFLNVSFVGSNALAAELGDDGHGVIVSQVVPYPWDPALALTHEFRELLAKYAPNVQPTFTNIEGFIAAKILVEGLRRTGRDLTRERLIATLEGMNRVDVGGLVAGFSPDNHSASRQVQLTVIIGNSGKFLFL